MPETKTKPKPARSRHRRDTSNPPPIRLQARDVEILKYVFQHRFLTTRQIVLLIDGRAALKPPADAITKSGDPLTNEQHFYNRLTTYQRRLAALWHNHFVDRVGLPVYMGQGSGEAVYMLAANGIDVLAEHTGEDPKLIRWSEKQNRVGERYLKHGVMASDFLVCVQVGCRYPDFKQVAYIDKGHSRDLYHSFEVDIGREKTTLHFTPDHIFALKDGRGTKKTQYHHCLEADRSTMDHTRMAKKYLGYWHYRQRQLHKEKLAIPDFRVLTICKSDARRQGLRGIIHRLNIPDYDKRKLFWFATTNTVQLNNPVHIFAPIWQTGAPNQGKDTLNEQDRSWALLPEQKDG